MMTEQINLSKLKESDSVKVTAGKGHKKLVYDITVLKSGEMPLCTLIQTSSNGSTVGPAEVIIEGTGNWTTAEDNPVQWGDAVMGKSHQAIAMSIGQGILRVGGFLIGHEPHENTGQRIQFMPECTELELIK